MTTSAARRATPERWQAALRRAITNGVQVRQLAGSGQWIATSGRRADLAYATDGVACECEAHALGNDPVCQHRAMYWHALGALTPALDRPCAWCGGRGLVADPDGHHAPEQCPNRCPIPGGFGPAVAAPAPLAA